MTTIADGSALIPIIPNSAVFINLIQNSTFLPFCIVPGNTSNPYTLPYIKAPNGPFSTQVSNFVTYAVDGCMMDFI